MRQVPHALLTRPPLSKTKASFHLTPFDLHVLSTPPAFVLSQDQTLVFNPSNLVFWSPSPSRSKLILRINCRCSSLSLYRFQGPVPARSRERFAILPLLPHHCQPPFFIFFHLFWFFFAFLLVICKNGLCKAVLYIILSTEVYHRSKAFPFCSSRYTVTSPSGSSVCDSPGSCRSWILPERCFSLSVR